MRLLTADGMLAKVLNVSEDTLRAAWPNGPKWAFQFIWRCRFLLNEDRTRRLLRKAIHSWSKSGIYSQDYFYDYDLKSDLDGRTVVVTLEWKNFQRRTQMSGPTATELGSQKRMDSQSDPDAAENLTAKATELRNFLSNLRGYLFWLSNGAMPTTKENQELEAGVMKGYCTSIECFLNVPYSQFVPPPRTTVADSNFSDPETFIRTGGDYRPDCKACRDLVAHIRHVLDSENMSEAPQAEYNPQPDLRTLEGALYFISSHELDQERKSAVVTVNQNFETLLRNVWQNIPAGPGKTRALHAINRARMECNAAITAYGA